jgi:hypothetical protein
MDRLCCVFGIVCSSKCHPPSIQSYVLILSIYSDGQKVLFRIALAIFKLNEHELSTRQDSLEIFQIIQVNFVSIHEYSMC